MNMGDLGHDPCHLFADRYYHTDFSCSGRVNFNEYECDQIHPQATLPLVTESLLETITFTLEDEFSPANVKKTIWLLACRE